MRRWELDRTGQRAWGGRTTEFALKLLAAKAVLALALFFLAAVTLFTSRLTTGHILTIIDAWKRLAKGDFSVRVKSRVKDERNQLVLAFNISECLRLEAFISTSY